MNGPYPPSGVGPGDFVFAAVALGRRHVNWSLAMIESLRTNGGFLGSIYLATDHPRSYSGMDDVVVVPVQGGGRAAAKRYKTTLFEWVPADRVVYIDADVVVGGTLDDWWCHLAELRRDKSLLVFADPGHGEEPWHTGLLVAERSACEDLFRRWYAALIATRDSSILVKLQGGRDQHALAMVADPECVGVLAPEYLMMPGRHEIQELVFSTFTHITYTYRRRLVTPRAMRRYLRDGPGLRYLPVSRFDLMGYLHPLGVRLVGLWHRLTGVG